MRRPVMTTDADGGAVLLIQLRGIARRPVAVDSQGWELADAPGPHAHGPIPFAPINRRPVRAEELQP